MFSGQLFSLSNLFLLDPLSSFFVFVTLLISIPAAIYSFGYLRGAYSGSKITYASVILAAFVVSMLAVVTAANAVVFLIAWEIMKAARITEA